MSRTRHHYSAFRIARAERGEMQRTHCACRGARCSLRVGARAWIAHERRERERERVRLDRDG